jgi:hypothetical protein
VGIALDRDIDSSVIVIVGGRLAFVNLGELNPGTGLLLQRLDGRASFTDDMGSCRLGNCDLYGLL